MKIIIRNLSFFTLTVSLGANAESLCNVNEKLIFSCQIKKSTKIVSLCGSKDLSSTEGYLQYRFGSPNKLELIYPETNQRTQQKFYWAEKHGYQVSVSEVTFINGGHYYTLGAHSSSEEMSRMPGGTSGGEVNVQKKGESSSARLECTKYPEGNFNLSGVVANDDELIGK